MVVILQLLMHLQEQRIHLLANGRPLGHGDYKDASRPLRRLLKQYGNGSLEGGLRYVAGSASAQAETIALLSVDKPVRALSFGKTPAALGPASRQFSRKLELCCQLSDGLGSRKVCLGSGYQMVDAPGSMPVQLALRNLGIAPAVPRHLGGGAEQCARPPP